MNYLVVIILSVQCGFLFLFIVLSHKLLAKQIRYLNDLLLLFEEQDIKDIYFLQEHLVKQDKLIKKLKRRQTVAQTRQRKILKLQRKIYNGVSDWWRL